MLIKKNINVSKRTSNFDKQSQTYKYTLNQMKFLMSDSFEEYAHLKTYIKLWQTISNVQISYEFTFIFVFRKASHFVASNRTKII